MPAVCVWIPAFRLAVACRGTPDVLDEPLIVADRPERGRVVDCSPAAAALGVRRGMTLVQAQAVAHDARTVFDDPAADARTWSAILDALDAASPLVEDDEPGRAYVEMHGIAGGARGWLAGVRAALAGFDLPLRLGLGPNRFVARAAAWRGDGVACEGEPAAFLAPLPLALLDLDDDVRERLRLLGVTTLGELAALPDGPFVRRFGAVAADWHARARGIDERPLRPRPRALRIDRTLYGEGEAASEEQVLFALRTLVGRLVDDLCAAGRRAGRLGLFLECEDGETRELQVRVAQPTAVPATLFELLRARLEGVTLTAPVVGLRLAAEELAAGGVALSLFAAGDPDPDAIGVVLARLDAVLGEGKALRARVVDGPRLERRFALEPFALEPLATQGPRAEPPPLAAEATLQLRLVDPRPVEVRMLGGAPRFVGSPPQEVLELAGPWRVEEGWWTPATGEASPLARDEYDVCLEDGALLRIAREAGGWTLRGVYD
ncbi:MAG TPA: DNA polymerase Y family protein [Candidatus Baltobacteraceae bacterium]|nr:DNA polymerase Y family protein [Candidatus Baltobacteraceae bacterium]